jgi:hypothetical protein
MDTLTRLDEALAAATPAIRDALLGAERELERLGDQKRELESKVERARAVLGESYARLTLHAALELVLREHGNDWMEVRDLARIVNERDLYRKQDGSRVEANQIHARTTNYADVFEKDRSRVRLRAS